jgi:hypothetical protein
VSCSLCFGFCWNRQCWSHGQCSHRKQVKYHQLMSRDTPEQIKHTSILQKYSESVDQGSSWKWCVLSMPKVLHFWNCWWYHSLFLCLKGSYLFSFIYHVSSICVSIKHSHEHHRVLSIKMILKHLENILSWAVVSGALLCTVVAHPTLQHRCNSVGQVLSSFKPKIYGQIEKKSSGRSLRSEFKRWCQRSNRV